MKQVYFNFLMWFLYMKSVLINIKKSKNNKKKIVYQFVALCIPSKELTVYVKLSDFRYSFYRFSSFILKCWRYASFLPPMQSPFWICQKNLQIILWIFICLFGGIWNCPFFLTEWECYYDCSPWALHSLPRIPILCRLNSVFEIGADVDFVVCWTKM